MHVTHESHACLSVLMCQVQARTCTYEPHACLSVLMCQVEALTCTYESHACLLSVLMCQVQALTCAAAISNGEGGGSSFVLGGSSGSLLK